MASEQAGSRVAAVIACYIVPIPLEICSTGLRIYAKQRQSKDGRDRFTIDDFLIVFATVSGLPMSYVFRLPCERCESKPDLAL